MVLLTSSQVSILITSFIIFLFTSALFFSGYALQQQTVRDLRAAIKPIEVPKEQRLYLPPKFAKPSPKEEGVVLEVKQSEKGGKNNKYGIEVGQEPILLKEQTSEMHDSPLGPEAEGTIERGDKGEEKPISRAERRRRIKEEIMAGSEEQGFKGYRRRMW